jgi:agmatine deiminase
MDGHDARGRRLRVHKLPMPGPLYVTRQEARGVVQRDGIRRVRAGQRMAGSYVNFYLANRAVVVPLLDAQLDPEVLRRLRGIFPDRQIVGVPAREILLGGGNIHCITQQVPALARRSAPGKQR